MQYFGRGGATDDIRAEHVREALGDALEQLGPRRRVLAIPPDFTRYHSRAGMITRLLFTITIEDRSRISCPPSGRTPR